MKKILLPFVLLFITAINGNAQENQFHLKNNLIYRTIINGSTDGFLVNMNDSSVMVNGIPQVFGNGKTGKVFKYSDIDGISIIDKRKPILGLLWGAAGGAVLGTIVGLATYESKGPFDIGGRGANAVTIGALTGLTGGLIGLGMGSIKYKVAIGRQKEAFRNMYTEIAVRE